MADEEGFLSRWSRRKKQATVEERAPEASQPQVVQPDPQPQVPVAAALSGDTPAEPAADLPTLEQAQALSFESDFRRFVAPGVPAEVKTAAMKKLFADARFNVRDMMDIYADDYSQPDPLPESMLRQLASAKFLGFFSDEREDADDVAAQNVAQSLTAPQAVPEPPHAHADLRLQQDDAPAGREPGAGVERGAAAPHEPVPPGGGEFPEGDPR